jgi:structural maintenance of chromosome 4
MLSFHHTPFRCYIRIILQGGLGMLGTIPDKYDVAVSTACGVLNNMVIDTVAFPQGKASSCASRTPDACLEKLSTDKLNERAVTLEGITRLFDLIKPNDPRFAHALYKGFLDVLCCGKS